MHEFDSVAPSAPYATDPRLLRNLNPEQLAAVTLPPGAALILAGAGSGKTRVLTTRIAWLIQTGQVSPGGVLAVTFTNKAAKEMLTRLRAMLPVTVRGMWIGTFHGLCNRFLRAHWKLAALPQGFQILDTQDQLSAVKRVIKAMNLDEERFVPKQMTWFIAGSKDDGLRPSDVEVHDEQTRKMVEVYQAYDDQCQREGVVDFAELMLRTYELLRDNDPLREHYQRRFRHILVDEFQDTNRLQYAWLKMFAPPGEPSASACSRSATTTRASTPFAARRSATWPTSSASTACAQVDQAGAQLPLVRQHPRRRQRADRPQRAPPGQEPAHRGRARRAGARATRRPATSPRRSGSSRRRSQLHRERQRRAARSRCSTAAMRRAG